MTDSKKLSRREKFEARKAQINAETAEKKSAIQAKFEQDKADRAAKAAEPVEAKDIDVSGTLCATSKLLRSISRAL